MEEIETQHSNMEEAEMGQLQALHLNMNALAAHRAAMEKQASQISNEDVQCEHCGRKFDITESLSECPSDDCPSNATKWFCCACGCDSTQCMCDAEDMDQLDQDESDLYIDQCDTFDIEYDR